MAWLGRFGTWVFTIWYIQVLLAIAGAAQTPGTLRWESPIEGKCYACPTVGPDGVIYIATHTNGGILYKFRGEDGSLLDSRFIPGTVEHSPALDDQGRLFLVTLKGIKSPSNPLPSLPLCMCLDAETLATIWTTTLANGSDNTPILGNNRVYTGLVSDPRTPTPFVGQHYYALNADTGAVTIDMFVEGWGASPGVIDQNGRIFFGVEDLSNHPTPFTTTPAEIWPGVFYALQPADPPDPATPTLAWPKFHANGECGSPVSCASGVIFATCRDGNLYGFSAETGEIRIQRNLGAPSTTGVTIGRDPLSGHLLLYTGTQSIEYTPGSGSRFMCIELDGSLEGAIRWNHQAPGGMSFGNAALDDLGNVYYTTTLGILTARTPGGSLLWTYTLPGGGDPTKSLGGIGGPTILDDGTIVSSSNGGKLVALWGNGNHLADDAPWPKYKHDLRNTSNVNTPIRPASSTEISGWRLY